MRDMHVSHGLTEIILMLQKHDAYNAPVSDLAVS